MFRHYDALRIAIVALFAGDLLLIGFSCLLLVRGYGALPWLALLGAVASGVCLLFVYLREYA